MNQSVNTKVRKEYSYFAFISYSRKDEKWAEWLQTRLENYRLPAALRKENVDLPAKIFPVFRDKTDLSGVGVEDSLHRELEASKYLIVICSKNAGASEWVSKEVEYFISLGRQDAILPFIIEEEGFAEDDCYPEALRSKRTDLLGISVAELGKQKAFLRVVSTLLELRYDQVVMREEKRRRSRQMLAALAAVVCVIVSGTVIWYNTPHSKYYTAVTYQYEIPQGLHELSKKDRESLYSSYRITTQRGQVISLECVNSAGVTVEPMLSIGATEVPVTTFQYDEKGQLISSDQRDVYGQLITHKVYSYHLEASQIAVDFRTPSNGIQAMAMSADQARGDLIQTGNESRSQITRMIHLYDDNGYLIRATYQKDNLGTAACDSNGVFGKQYTYTEKGQILRATNLDVNGQEHNCAYGWAAMEYTYDDMGRVIGLQYYDTQGNKVRSQDKVSLQTMTYDDGGNAVCLQIFDETGVPYLCEEGYAVRTCQYDDQGFITDRYQFGLDGKPVMGTENIHHWQYETDENGRILKTSFYDILGQSVYSKTYQYASQTNVLDEQGRVVEQRTFGVEGEPLPNRDNGAYGVRLAYDEWGNVTETVYLDEQGQPAPSLSGYTILNHYYNESGNLLRVEYRDEKGDLMRAANHVSVEIGEYDVFGNITSQSYWDEQEDPCYFSDGTHRVELVYENGNPTWIRYYDIYGEPVFGPEGAHGIQLEYDAQGHAWRLSYYDCIGNLMKSSNGYAVSEMEYDTYGRMLEVRRYDAHLEPIDGDQAWRNVMAYDERGNRIRNQSFYVDEEYQDVSYSVYAYDDNDRQIGHQRYDEEGNLLRSDSLSAETIRTYDAAGNLICEERLDADGYPFRHDQDGILNVKEYEYDIYGNLIQTRQYHGDRSGKRQCLYVSLLEYDSYGNGIHEEYQDGKGNLRLNKDDPQYAIRKRGYDELGNLIWEEYYGVDGKPCLYEEDAFRFEHTYQNGILIESHYYDVDGQLMHADNVRYAMQRCERSEFMDLSKLTVYDENGSMMYWAEYTYDERGFLTKTAMYYAGGELVKDEVPYVMVSSVQEGSPAEAAGIRRGDVLIQYGSWNLFQKEVGSSSFEWMKTEINKNTADEKIVIVAHLLENIGFEFAEAELSEGNIGIGITERNVSSKAAEILKEAYIRWSETEK